MRLRYAMDDRPGLSRVRAGRHFVYRQPDGSVVRNESTLARIRRLAIPPAWAHVWIARDPSGHLQATGRDARGRKQYRYHPAWTAARDAAKYDHLLDFARTLPAIRRQVATDLGAPALSRPRVLATVIALLERTHIRVGNDEYARENQSYGLTTLLNRHVRVRGPKIEFRFRGKSGVPHVIALNDLTLARSVQRCQELPGQTLFEYRDDAGRIRRVGSTDVNRYLEAIAGPGITAKDFRTWWGTVSAAVLLRQAQSTSDVAQRERVVLDVLNGVAAQLRNTRAVCRKCYVHPHVIEAFMRGLLMRPVRWEPALRGLTSNERAVVALLQRMRRTERTLSRPVLPSAAVA